jgi:hypothetical protein
MGGRVIKLRERLLRSLVLHGRIDGDAAKAAVTEQFGYRGDVGSERERRGCEV